MAITISSLQVQSDFANANWTKNKLIDALESVFATAGLHGAALSGFVKGYSSGGTQYGYYTNSVGQAQGGGTHGSIDDGSGSGTTATTNYGNFTFVNIPATGGTGTGATFDVQYNGGTLYRCYVNRSGSGYTNGDVLTISASSLLGASNGSANITITVQVDSTSRGGSSSFFYKQATQTSQYPWAILKLDIDTTKTYGSVYYAIQVTSNTSIRIIGGLYWNPTYRYWGGARYMETSSNATSWSTITSTTGYDDGSVQSYGYYGGGDLNIQFSTTSSYPLYIKTYRASSPQDTNFALFQFAQPDIPSTDHLNDLYYGTFAFPKWTTSLYSLDNVGHAGVLSYELPSGTNTSFDQTYRLGGEFSLEYLPRYAEVGWCQSVDKPSSYGHFHNLYTTVSRFTWNAVKNNHDNGASQLYRRTASDDHYNEGDSDNLRRRALSSLPYQAAQRNIMPSAVNYSTVLKGIPWAPLCLPSPYNIPNDFVIVEIEYRTPSAKFLPGDTITVSAGEVYSIILGAYNNSDTTTTRGIFLCGRITG